jgi:2-keto-4-pentenoate hydratase
MTQNLDAWPTAPWTRVPASHKDAMEGFERQADIIKDLPKGAVPLAGWKIGTSDPATQHRFGLSTCLLGHLPGNTECDGSKPISLEGTTCPAIEPELWIEVGADINPNCTREEVIQAITKVGIAAELVDFHGRFDDLPHVMESNIFHHAYARSASFIPLDENLTTRITMTATRDDGRTWACPIDMLLPDLAAVVSFVAQNVHLLGETHVAAGQHILSGVVIPAPVWVQPGSTVTISADEIGSLSLCFAEKE